MISTKLLHFSAYDSIFSDYLLVDWISKKFGPSTIYFSFLKKSFVFAAQKGFESIIRLMNSLQDSHVQNELKP